MRLTLRQLQLFCAVARTGTTTAAAQAVALSQSATSAAINELQNALGIRLFERAGQRLLLNEAGRALLPQAQALLQQAQDIETQFSEHGLQGVVQLRLAASTTTGNYLLPRLLARWGAERPQAEVQVTIANTLDVARAVAQFEADLGFIEGPCHVAGLELLHWQRDELVLVAAPEHPLARRAAERPLSVTQLRQARWLLREEGSGTREAVEQVLRQRLGHIDLGFTLGSGVAIVQAVVAGLGISCLSRVLVREALADGSLVVLASCLPAMERNLSIVHRRTARLSPALRELIDLALAGEATDAGEVATFPTI